MTRIYSHPEAKEAKEYLKVDPNNFDANTTFLKAGKGDDDGKNEINFGDGCNLFRDQCKFFKQPIDKTDKNEEKEYFVVEFMPQGKM